LAEQNRGTSLALALTQEVVGLLAAVEFLNTLFQHQSSKGDSMAHRSVTTMALFFPAEGGRERFWLPNADVYRSSHGWLIKLDLAGVQPDEVEITASGTRLMISGCRRDRAVSGEWTPYSMEIAYSRFERIIELPFLVERTKMNVELREGMLLIYLTPEGEG